MTTPEQWMKINGYDSGVCCGHGDYDTLPKRLTIELVRRIQDDARQSLRREEMERRIAKSRGYPYQDQTRPSLRPADD